MLKPKELQLQLGQGYSCEWLTSHAQNTTIQVRTPFTLPDGTVIDVYVSEISQLGNVGIVLSDLGETAGWLCETNAGHIKKTETSPAIWTLLLPRHLHQPNNGTPSSEELYIAIPMFVERIQNFVNHVLEKVEEKRKEHGNKM